VPDENSTARQSERTVSGEANIQPAAPIAHAMFRRRLVGYRELGCRIELPPADTGSVLFGTAADQSKPNSPGAGADD